MAGMSRNELLQWLNELLQLNYTKVEQCGTGAAYCQIIDSIYGEHKCIRCSGLRAGHTNAHVDQDFYRRSQRALKPFDWRFPLNTLT